MVFMPIFLRSSRCFIFGRYAAGAHSLRKASSASGLSLHYRDEDIAVITMGNTENRINLKFVTDFHTLLDSVERNASCKALITTAEGKFFSNGVDQAWLPTVSSEEVDEFCKLLISLCLKILIFPLPTLAAMNGHAYAGGAVIALAHDLRTMNSERGFFCLNEVLLNLKFSRMMRSYLIDKLGGTNVNDVIVLGKRFTALEACNKHIIHAAVPPANLMAESVKVLRPLLGKEGYPREGLSNMKKDIYSNTIEAFEEEYNDPHAEISLQFMTEAQIETFTKRR